MTPPDEHPSDETAPRRGWPQDWGRDEWGTTWAGAPGASPQHPGPQADSPASAAPTQPPSPGAGPQPSQSQSQPPSPGAGSQPSQQRPSYEQQPAQGQQPSFGPPPQAGPPPSYGQPSGYGAAAPPSWEQAATYGQPSAYAQPSAYGQPAPHGQAWPTGQPPAPRRGRGRRVWLIVGLAVVLLAGLTVGGIALFRPSDPELTFDGREVANADSVLSGTEQSVRKLADSRHGATNANTRCYFTRPRTAPSGGKASDVDDALRCGPVLFVDGVSDKAYLSYALSAGEPEDGKVSLSAAAQATDPSPATVPTELSLVRPDGKTAPGGAGGLRVPDPPKADKDLFAAQDLGTGDLPAAPGTARIVSRRSGVTVTNLGPLTRYGAGDTARSAPEGQKMIGFVLTRLGGEYADDPFSALQLGVSIDGGTRRLLPAGGSSAKPYVLAYPATARSVDLITTDSGFAQRVSLLNGRPGSTNISLLTRERRSADLRIKTNFNYQLTGEASSAPWPATAQAGRAYLYYWLGNAANAPHPKLPTSAFLYIDATYTYTTPVPSGFTGTGGGPYGFRTSFCSLVTPDGRKYPAVNRTQVAGKIFNVFEVPASFTRGTMVVSGSYKNPNNVTLSVPTPLRLNISIPLK